MYVDNNMRHRVNAANILQTLPPRLRAMVQVTACLTVASSQATLSRLCYNVSCSVHWIG